MSIRSAFVDEGAALVRAVSELNTSQLARSTRCHPWDVKTLVSHVVRGAERVGEVAQTAGVGKPDPDAYVYYRSPLRSDPVRDEVRNRAAAEAAARFSSAGQIAEALGEAVTLAVEWLDRVGSETPITTHWGPVLRFEDYLLTRVVELSVHGIDLADALDLPVWLSPAAAEEVAALLRALLPAGVPEAASWGDEVLIRIGTGRLTPQTNQQWEAMEARGFPLIR